MSSRLGAVRPHFAILLIVAALLLPGGVITNYPVEGGIMRSHYHKAPAYAFPNGGRTIFPAYRIVALYGTPNTPELGALGEQDAAASMTRAKTIGSLYQPLVSEHILPAVEIITTVASAFPTDSGSYSYAIPLSTLRVWVSAARAAGVYVVLDLQPGRNDFLTQARQFEAILKEPNVGLALDPEWRLKPNERPLEQIGSVDIAEVNQTAAWLANIIDTDKLPQKLFLLHEFSLSMLPAREQLDTTHGELAYVVQMDGQGSQPAKLDTWQAVTANPPTNVHFGWKNFYTKDAPIRSPEDTMRLVPQPWYVSYQ